MDQATTIPATWGRADLHIHSGCSDGLDTVERILDHVSAEARLDVVAITDHDEVRGALAARELAARRSYRLEIVVGTEVTTRHGHLLALYVERPIPMLRSLEWTLDEVHAQGGLAIVPHPMSWLIPSVGRRALLRVIQRQSEGLFLDGIELLAPSWAGRVAAGRAAVLNDAVLRLPALGGSDAHARALIGTAATAFPGRTAEELRQAILAGQTRPYGRNWTVSEHLNGVHRQLWRSMVAHPGEKVVRSLGLRRHVGT